MAIFQLQAKDAVVRINQYDALNCVQSLNWDSAMNAEQHEQLGDANYTAQSNTPEVTGSFEVRSTGALSSFLSRMIYVTNSGTGEFEGPKGVANTNLIRETDLQFAVFDLIESKKANEVFDRSTLIPRAHLSSFSLSARSDGSASESYSFEADLLEVYRKPYHDLVSVPVTRLSTALTTTVEVPLAYEVDTEAAPLAPATHRVWAMDIDGVRVPHTLLTVTAQINPAKDQVALSAAAVTAGYSIPLGARVHLIMYRKTPGSMPVITYPTTARFVKADQINIWLLQPSQTFTVDAVTDTVENLLAAGKNLSDIPFTDADLWLRVQSLDIQVPLSREPLREIRKNDRGNSIYFRSVTFPLQISASVATIESDLNDWAKLQQKELYGADATPDILNLADFEGKTYIIATRYYKQGTALQTVALLDARLDSIGGSVATRSNASRSMSFTGSKIAVQGK